MPRGMVKFFNPAKGFGFISPEDGGADIFVHISAVERSGLNGLDDGDQVTFEVQQDRRSGKLEAVDLEQSGSGPAPGPRSPRSTPPQRGYEQRGDDRAPRRTNSGGHDREPAGSSSGVVKWFNQTKGFGFIQPHDGGGDVFVHISAIEQAGWRGLEERQVVAFDLEQDRRSGKTSATNLRLER